MTTISKYLPINMNVTSYTGKTVVLCKRCDWSYTFHRNTIQLAAVIQRANEHWTAEHWTSKVLP